MVIDDVANALSAKDDQELMDRIWTRFRFEYFRICGDVSWDFLRPAPVTLDFSAADSTGLWLPSDLIGIDQVWDDTNGREFFEVGRAAAQDNQWGYRFYRYEPSRSSLFSGSDLSLSTNSTQFTSAALTADGADPDGFYVQFGSEPGFYLVSSSTTPFTFTPTYTGPQQQQKNFSVRPWQSTRKMVLIDPSEDALLDRSVDVYYWRYPVAPYQESDQIPTYLQEVLRLRTLRGIFEAKERAPVSENALRSAYQEAIKANQPFTGITSPRDKHNNRMDMATNPFGER
jgi:hypothetical protein